MLRVFSILAAAFVFTNALAKEVSIDVKDNSGGGLANVVVYLTSKSPVESPIATDIAIMDQINTQFSPHILPVQKDTNVRFPNSDSIKHHVYSFSPAKVFELQLYKDLQADPLMFSKTGVVELGCNVHDWMLGYIYVVDTPFFAKTNEQGKVVIDVPSGEYQANIWHPRIQDELTSLTKTIDVAKQSSITIGLAKPMLPNLNQYEEESGEFSDYE